MLVGNHPVLPQIRDIGIFRVASTVLTLGQIALIIALKMAEKA